MRKIPFNVARNALGYDKAKTYSLINAGVLSSIKVGGRRFIVIESTDSTGEAA